MANTTTILALAGAAGLGLYAYGKSQEKAKKAKTKEPEAPTGPHATPFVEGSACAETIAEERMLVWMDQTVRNVFEEELEEFPEIQSEPPENVTQELHDQVMDLKLWELVDEIADRVMGPCPDKDTDAYAFAWKSIWCAVAQELTQRGRLNKDEEQLYADCEDGSFDPHRDRPPPVLGPVIPTVPLPPLPPIEPEGGVGPVFPPFPGIPPEPPEPPGEMQTPMPPAVSWPPQNVNLAQTKEDIRDSSFMRMVEAIPERLDRLPTYKTVVLGYDPEWEDFPRARADLTTFAQAHPDVAFYMISFWDTQREYGKPELLGTLRYILTASGPEPQGYAYQWPMIGEGALVAAPTKAQWARIVDYAQDGPAPVTVSVSENPPITVAQASAMRHVLRSHGHSANPRSVGAQILGLAPAVQAPRRLKPRRRGRGRTPLRFGALVGHVRLNPVTHSPVRRRPRRHSAFA